MSRPPRSYTTDAVVLRTRRMGEADAVLTLLTPEKGKFDAVARGVRKATSRKAGHLQPLTISTLLIAQGSSLDVITQAQTREAFLPLRDDLHRLGAALYAAELVDRYTVEREESHLLFALLSATLGWLSDGEPVDIVLRYFELHLLSATGFRPELYTCVSCAQELQPVRNAFSVAAGGVVCPNCVPPGAGLPWLSVNALKVLRLILRSEYPEVARLRLGDTLMQELESLLRTSIQRQLEREPRSLPFLREMRHQYEPSRAGVS